MSVGLRLLPDWGEGRCPSRGVSSVLRLSSPRLRSPGPRWRLNRCRCATYPLRSGRRGRGLRVTGLRRGKFLASRKVFSRSELKSNLRTVSSEISLRPTSIHPVDSRPYDPPRINRPSLYSDPCDLTRETGFIKVGVGRCVEPRGGHLGGSRRYYRLLVCLELRV